MEKDKKKGVGILGEKGRAYCEATTVHGFAYWVAAPTTPEKIFWVCVVLTGFTCAGLIVDSAIRDWIENPGDTGIETFTMESNSKLSLHCQIDNTLRISFLQPITEVDYPALTFCNPDGYDTGEYVRAVFNNFAFKESTDVGANSESQKLRGAFDGYIGEVAANMHSFLHYYVAKEMSLNVSDEYLAVTEQEINEAMLGLALSPNFETNGMHDIKGTMRDLFKDLFKGIERKQELRDLTGWIMPPWTPTEDGDVWMFPNKETPPRYLKQFAALFDDSGVKTVWGKIWDCLIAKDANQYPRGNIFENGCFSDHATTAMSSAVTTAGPFAKFMIGKVFSEDQSNFHKGKFAYWTFKEYIAGPKMDMTGYCAAAGNCQTTDTKRQADLVKNKMLMSMHLTDDWPTENFANMLDGLVDASGKTIGIPKETFELYASAAFDGKVPNIDEKVAFPKYPVPARLVNLLRLKAGPAKSGGLLHPSLMSGIPVTGILRLQKYSVWMECEKRKTGKKAEDIVKEEVEKYKDFKTKGSTIQVPNFIPSHVLEKNLAVETREDIVAYSLTDSGICSTINGQSLSATYEKGGKIDTLGDILDPRGEAVGAIKNLGSGSMYRSSFWLNVRNGAEQGRSQGELTMAISDFKEYFNVRSERILIEAGMQYTIKLYPTVHSTTEGFRDISLEKRKCRFPNELLDGSKSMFKSYNQKGCIFECLMKKVTEQVGCLPWDFPFPAGLDSKEAPYCTTFVDKDGTNNTLKQFMDGLDDAGSSKQCTDQCLPDCEYTSYDYQVDTTELKPKKLCADAETRKMALDMWKSTGNALTWLYSQYSAFTHIQIAGILLKTNYGLENGLLDSICRSMFETNVARVHVEVAKPTVLRVEKRKNASFADQLGTVGGTVGLFTGLSLISVVEALYWIYQTIFACLSGRMSARKAKSARRVKTASRGAMYDDKK